MDAADVAKDLQDAHNAAALAAHRARSPAGQRPGRAGALRADCQDCGDPIPALRLIAVPHATRCAPCEGIAARGAR